MMFSAQNSSERNFLNSERSDSSVRICLSVGLRNLTMVSFLIRSFAEELEHVKSLSDDDGDMWFGTSVGE